jgi:hypothetical protein
MATDSDDTDDSAFRCDHCEETFDTRKEHDDHLRDAHNTGPEASDETAAESAAANSDAAASTGSITEETNDSPSAAEPGEAAGPAGSEGDTDPGLDLDHNWGDGEDSDNGDDEGD